MKKDVEEKMFKEKGIVYIPQFKKIWLSISKFEKYPEMAAEGVGRAIGYLALLIFIFSIILVACLTYQFNVVMNQSIDSLEKNISSLDYKDGVLNIELENQENKFITDEGTVIIDTGDVSDDKITEYQNTISSNNLGIIWLKDHAIVNFNGIEKNIYYQNALSELGVNEFNKTNLVNFLNNSLQSPQTYLTYFVMMLVYVFAAYFVSSLINVLLLSIFGVLTSLIAKMKMRYRAVFNMSVYAITLSTILQLIYILVNMFTNFEIKYFDLMYSAISYICLTAAIFMIKSDVIKQQIEMIKIVKEKKQQEEQKQDEEEKKEEKDKKDETSEENDSDNKNDEKESKKEDEGLGDEAEGQGLNA